MSGLALNRAVLLIAQPMGVLFVENDDSFSWNVIDALPFPRSAIEIVSGSDRVATRRELDRTDAVIIGPGPTDPMRADLIHLVIAAAERRTPLLGICLGHQAIGVAFGARLARVEPRHGKRSEFALHSRLLPGFSGQVTAMRYHSLAIEDVRPPLRIAARTDDGIVMAVEHESLPILGLQFHPDSFGTPLGREMLASFFGAALPVRAVA